MKINAPIDLTTCAAKVDLKRARLEHPELFNEIEPHEIERGEYDHVRFLMLEKRVRELEAILYGRNADG